MDLRGLRDRVLTLPVLESRLAILRKELQTAEDEIASLLRQYEKESRDVERVQKDSFSAFVFKLVGKYEDKLDKEYKEEVAAKLAYDEAAVRRDSLARELEKLSAHVAELHTEEKTYQAELENRRRELLGRIAEPVGIRYTALENERRKIVSRVTEINEAISAAAKAKQTAAQTLKKLKSAGEWAMFDVFAGGGVVGDMVKYSHIDAAEVLFHTLAAQMKSLRKELTDVQGITMPGFTEISSTQRTIDFWFDNIFTDLSVRDQVAENTDKVEGLIKDINRVQAELKARLGKAQAKLAENGQAEDELLIST